MRTSLVVLSLLGAVGSARAADRPVVEAHRRHDNPRFKISYRTFSIGRVDGTAQWLNGAQLDAYALSRRWVRLGVELEGGAGRTDLLATPVGLSYGLLGLTGGVQYPARVTPFVDGRAVAGVLHAQLDGSVTIGKVTLSDSSGTTYLYGGGVETGVEVYTVRRLYLSVALGWVRTTWRGPDVDAMLQHPTSTQLRTTDLTGDSFTFKVGAGI